MIGNCTLYHGNIKVCDCVFNSKGILIDVPCVYNKEHLPVICAFSDNYTRSMQEWLQIRKRWTKRADAGEVYFPNDKENTYESQFDMYSFGEQTQINLPTDKEIFVHDDIIMSRENINDCYLSSIASQANLICFTPGRYRIIKDTLYWTIPFRKENEYISLSEYIKPFMQSGVSEAKAAVACCMYYAVPEWKNFFIDLCSVDDVINQIKNLNNVFILRDRNDLHKINGLVIL